MEVDGAECRWVHGLVITYIQNILLQCIWFTYICNEQTHIYTYIYIYIYNNFSYQDITHTELF